MVPLCCSLTMWISKPLLFNDISSILMRVWHFHMLQICFIFIFIEVTFILPLCVAGLQFLKVLGDTFSERESTSGSHAEFLVLLFRGVCLWKNVFQGYKWRAFVLSNIKYQFVFNWQRPNMIWARIYKFKCLEG